MNRTERRISSAAAILAAVLSVAAAPVRAADPAAFLAAQAEFERGAAGDSAANERACAQFQQLADAEPGHPLPLAYLGATWTLKGRDAWAPWNKMRHTERGLALLDKALALLGPAHDLEAVRGVPVSEEVRLTAASTFLAVPAFMHRTEAARVTLADALQGPALAASPGPVQARLLVQAAALARHDAKPAEEADALRRALLAWPDGPTAAPARARLQELGK